MNDALAKKRHYFRFRLRTLLMLPLLFAAGWWWVTWPERTAKEFVRLLNAGDIETARAMIDEPPLSIGFWKIAESRAFTFDAVEFQPGSWREYLLAVRTFRFDWRFKNSSGDLGPFLASQNRISLGPLADNRRFAVSYRLHHSDPDVFAERLDACYPDDGEFHFAAINDRRDVIVAVPEYAHGEISALTTLFESEQPP